MWMFTRVWMVMGMRVLGVYTGVDMYIDVNVCVCVVMWLGI